MAGTHPVIREVKKEGDENEEKNSKFNRLWDLMASLTAITNTLK